MAIRSPEAPFLAQTLQPAAMIPYSPKPSEGLCRRGHAAGNFSALKLIGGGQVCAFWVSRGIARSQWTALEEMSFHDSCNSLTSDQPSRARVTGMPLIPA